MPNQLFAEQSTGYGFKKKKTADKLINFKHLQPKSQIRFKFYTAQTVV